MAKEKVRVAAVADIHCGRSSPGDLQPLFSAVREQADMLLLCGDLTDYGLPEEAKILAKELASLTIPIVAVLGNHDFESGHQDELCEILAGAGVTLLDGEACEVCGIGIAGAKGFAGGFGQWALGSWGERAIKRFVHEAVEETLKLEAALARLSAETRIAVLHYAPVPATVEGEPPELFAFLGSSRLEEPLNRHPLAAVFHGHAHHGSPEGRTAKDIPVYNVSVSVLKKAYPDRPTFRLLELPAPSPNGGSKRTSR